jgi:hypothetical protein
MNRIRYFCIGLTLCLSPLITFGQIKTKELKVGDYVLQAATVNPEENDAFIMVGEMPEFPGGIDSLLAYAKKFLFYPHNAIDNNIQGKVILQFTVDSTGKTCNTELIRSVFYDIDTLCIAMVKHMPRWKPGELYSKKVSVWFIWPINFILTDN